MDKSAIEAIREADATATTQAAVDAAMDVNTLCSIVAAPAGYVLHDLEKSLQTRRRMRGVMRTQSLADFVAFVLSYAQPGGAVFIDPKALEAHAVLNLGTFHEPGHADNLAILKAEPTAAFKALHAATASAMTQMVAAEFVEDWSDCVRCFSAPDKLIPTHQAIAAIRKLTIESLRKVESDQQSLRATTSTFEDVQAKSADPLPVQVVFKCQPAVFLAPREFVLRFGVLTGGKEPAIVLRMSKREEHEQAMAEEMQGLLAKGFSAKPAEEGRADVVVAIGSYKPAP